MMKRTIAILFHETDHTRDLTSYMITGMADIWREDGHDVIFLFGVTRYVPADLILVHVDLSVVPDKYLDFAHRYPIVVNGKIKDIRKSTISQNLVKPGDAYDGKVIVKTDLNYAGVPERIRNSTWLSENYPRLARLTSFVRPARSNQLAGVESPSDYRIYNTVRDVPPEIFQNKQFVVEKFLPEFENGQYYIRLFQFLGDRMTCLRLCAETPIVNANSRSEREIVEPHPDMIALRHRLKFDYGKFDYVIHNGQPVLLDANKTVGGAKKATGSIQQSNRKYRAAGIYAYFQ